MSWRLQPPRDPVCPTDPTPWDLRVMDLLKRYPRAWAAFCIFTLNEIDKGETRVGAKAAWEHMRYQAKIELRDRGDQWALNNSLTASFPRIFMCSYPEHQVFETRQRPTERRAA